MSFGEIVDRITFAFQEELPTEVMHEHLAELYYLFQKK